MSGAIMVAVKMLLTLLLFLFILLTGVSLRPTEIYVKAGEMVALHCPLFTGYNHENVKVVWINHTAQKMYVSSNMSSPELRQMGVMVQRRSLVILSASTHHQGNYSCSVGNTSRKSWFTLTVNTAQSEYEERTMYPVTCYTQESCTLYCPAVNIPAENTPNITSNGITWYKEGESLPTDGYFSSVEKKDSGVYTCTRSYLHNGQTYKKTFTVELDVKPKQVMKTAKILSPRMNAVFHVDLGSTVVIDCKVVSYSKFDGVFWLSGKSPVDTKVSSPVFFNSTWEKNADEIKMTTSLVFKKVSAEDLSKNYTCKLESVYQTATFVSMTLKLKDLKTAST